MYGIFTKSMYGNVDPVAGVAKHVYSLERDALNDANYMEESSGILVAYVSEVDCETHEAIEGKPVRYLRDNGSGDYQIIDAR